MDMKMGNESTDSQTAEKKNTGLSCALCRELPGSIRVVDAKGRQLRICLKCDRLIEWR